MSPSASPLTAVGERSDAIAAAAEGSVAGCAGFARRPLERGASALPLPVPLATGDSLALRAAVPRLERRRRTTTTTAAAMTTAAAAPAMAAPNTTALLLELPDAPSLLVEEPDTVLPELELEGAT